MSTRIEGARTWVIGASSGIGAAVARELHARGAQVAISARRREKLEDVSGGRMIVVPADVTDDAGLASAADRVREELGGIDLAVLCAGLWEQMDATEWDHDQFRRHVEVNLIGMGAAIAAVLPSMLARGQGRIVGVASVAGYRGIPGAEAYGATKAAQINLLEGLRAAVKRHGVTVTTVNPGFVRTEMTDANDFPMPFMIDADRAARAICTGIARGRAEIIFPLPMAVMMKIARLLPTRLWTAAIARASRGSGSERSDQDASGDQSDQDAQDTQDGRTQQPAPGGGREASPS